MGQFILELLSNLFGALFSFLAGLWSRFTQTVSAVWVAVIGLVGVLYFWGKSLFFAGLWAVVGLFPEAAAAPDMPTLIRLPDTPFWFVVEAVVILIDVNVLLQFVAASVLVDILVLTVIAAKWLKSWFWAS